MLGVVSYRADRIADDGVETLCTGLATPGWTYRNGGDCCRSRIDAAFRGDVPLRRVQWREGQSKAAKRWGLRCIALGLAESVTLEATRLGP